MIEITAKQLYEAYEVCINRPCKKTSLTKSGWRENSEFEAGKKVTFFREITDVNNEWKPTTDLIIKA